jgi:hypothetical protein
MANDFQIQAKQLTTSFAEFVPGIDTATTNQTVHAIYFSNITTCFSGCLFETLRQ